MSHCSSVQRVALSGPSRHSCFQLRGLKERSWLPGPAVAVHISTPSLPSWQSLDGKVRETHFANGVTTSYWRFNSSTMLSIRRYRPFASITNYDVIVVKTVEVWGR